MSEPSNERKVLEIMPGDPEAERLMTEAVKGIPRQDEIEAARRAREEREKARLASAFWKGNRSRERARLIAVPTGFRSGRYTVLLQFASQI